MNNGITTLQNLLGSQQIPAASTNTFVKATNVQPAEGQTDQASLSSVGDLIARAVANVDPAGDVRLEKIASLQQAIAAGTYNISASDVAGRIVDSLLG